MSKALGTVLHSTLVAVRGQHCDINSSSTTCALEIKPKSSGLVGSTTHNGIGPAHQSLIKKNALQSCLQPDLMESFS